LTRATTASLADEKQDVDGRDKPGHDVVREPFRLAEKRHSRTSPSRLAAVGAMRHDRAEIQSRKQCGKS